MKKYEVITEDLRTFYVDAYTPNHARSKVVALTFARANVTSVREVA